MKKSYCLLVFVLVVLVAATALAKDDTERPIPFKDAVRASEVEPNDDCTIANPLDLADPLTASINPETDIDWFSFQATGGTCVVFETAPGENQVGGDTRMWLYADDCTTELAFNDDGGDGLYSLIEYEFTVGGTYYLQIDEFGNNNIIDAYVLMADECPPPPEENGSWCNFVALCYDWDFAVSDHGFMGEPCDPTGGTPVWEYGAEMTIPGAPGNVWATVLNGDYPSGSGEGLLSPPFMVVPEECDWMEVKHYVHTEWF